MTIVILLFFALFNKVFIFSEFSFVFPSDIIIINLFPRFFFGSGFLKISFFESILCKDPEVEFIISSIIFFKAKIIDDGLEMYLLKFSKKFLEIHYMIF